MTWYGAFVILCVILGAIAFVVAIPLTQRLLAAMCEILDDKDYYWWVRTIMFFAVLIVTAWYIIISFIGAIITVFSGYEIAKTGRDWWNK